MIKSKKNFAIMVTLITLLVALGSVFAIFGVFSKPTKMVEAAETRAPGLYNGSDFTSWDDLISSGEISITNGHLQVTDSGKDMAGELICGSVDGLTSLYDAFVLCQKLTLIDCSRLDTSGVTDMREAFMCCSALNSLQIANFNTSEVKSMYYMFMGCYSLRTLDLNNFDTRKVTDMSYMFAGCSFNTLALGEKFIIKSVCDTTMMFTSPTKAVEFFGFEPSDSEDSDYQYILAGKTPEERTMRLGKKLIGDTFDENNVEYDLVVALLTDSQLNTIVCPQLESGVTVALAPASNHFYALADDPTKAELNALSSATNGKTLKLYYRDTKTEIPPISSPDTPSDTGIATDITMIIVALDSILSLAVVATKKKRLAR